MRAKEIKKLIIANSTCTWITANNELVADVVSVDKLTEEIMKIIYQQEQLAWDASRNGSDGFHAIPIFKPNDDEDGDDFEWKFNINYKYQSIEDWRKENP